MNEDSENKKANQSNSISSHVDTKASRPNGIANIRINSENAISNLNNLIAKYQDVSNPKGLLTDLKQCLGLPLTRGVSNYGVLTIPSENGNTLQASLRITNHNANAKTYIEHDANYEYNLSIGIRKRNFKNRFKAHDDVLLDEFIYTGNRLKKIDQPLCKIIQSIITFIQTGTYKDFTNVAIVNHSPNRRNENKQINCNRNMKVTLKESELKQIIAKSVRRVLKESENPSSNKYYEYVANGVKNVIGICQNIQYALEWVMEKEDNLETYI